MKIVVLGWGSLVWDPRQLRVENGWYTGGPVLPLEFSRISGDGRLTLVIDERFGNPVSVRYAVSSSASLNEAIENLRDREGTARDRIGFVDLPGNRSSIRTPQVAEKIRHWAESNQFDAVIWTALGRRFREATGTPFSPEAALAYVDELTGDKKALAVQYITNAPEEVKTAFRRLFEQHFLSSP